MNPLCKVRDFLLYRLLPLSILLITFNCLAHEPISANADQSSLSSNTYSFKQLGWDKSVTLNGYKPNYSFYLPISKLSNPQKAILHLKLAFSPVLTQQTRVDIKFNQTTIRRLALAGDSSREASWDIELPLTQLSKNWQALDFAAYLTSTKNNLCDPDVWVYISPESSLTLSTKELPFDGLLNQLPYPFLEPATINPVSTLFVLPNNPAPQEVFSLLQIALRLGQLAGDSKVKLSCDFIDALDEKQRDNNLILVGTSEHLFKNAPPQIANLVANQDVAKALENLAGLLLLNQSPFNPMRGLLIFTGKDNSSLEKAISAFLTTEFKSLGSGKMAIINAIQVRPTAKVVGDWYHSTLKELGYPDQSVSGVGQRKLSYDIPLPNDRIPHNASVKTLITSPIFANEDNSQVTLLINGSKQASFRLIHDHSAWQTEIDNSAMKPGINRLEYLIDLHYAHESCTRQNFNEVWATIHAETEFTTSFFYSFPMAMLNQLPVPFNREITVVLPEQLSKVDINNLANLFFKFGRLFQPDTVNFKFQTSRETSEDFIRNSNVILYGRPETNPWVKFAFEYMPFQMKGNARVLKIPQKQMQVSGEQATGLLELMPSPWTEDRAVFLISGTSYAALSWATKALIDDKIRVGLNGNIALINADQSIEILNSYDNRYISFKTRMAIYFSNLGKNFFHYLLHHPQIFIYLLVLLVPLIIVLRKRKK